MIGRTDEVVRNPGEVFGAGDVAMVELLLGHVEDFSVEVLGPALSCIQVL